MSVNNSDNTKHHLPEIFLVTCFFSTLSVEQKAFEDAGNQGKVSSHYISYHKSRFTEMSCFKLYSTSFMLWL